MRRIATLKFASVFLIAVVCAGLSGQAFAVKRAVMQRSHQAGTFPLAAVESDVPAFA